MPDSCGSSPSGLGSLPIHESRLATLCHRYSVDWAEYCRKQKVNVNVIDHLLGAEAQVRAIGSRNGCFGGPLSQTCDGWASRGRNATFESVVICAHSVGGREFEFARKSLGECWSALVFGRGRECPMGHSFPLATSP